MSELYKVKLRIGTSIIEVESTDKSYVDGKLNEYLEKFSDTDNLESKTGKQRKKASKNKTKTKTGKVNNESKEVSISDLVAMIHDDETYESIEKNILNKRDRLGKILLCYYFANNHQDGPEITTGQVELLTDQLRIKIASSNVAKVIRQGASKYLTADQVRKRGATVKYKINRQGIKKYEAILKGEK